MRTLLTLACMFLAAAFLPITASAQGVSATAATPAASASENLTAILICNEVALRLRASADGRSAVERLRIVRDRIIWAYGNENIEPSNFRMVALGREWAIYVGKTLLVTAGEEEARANSTTPQALAMVWHRNLSSMMSRCPATMAPTLGR